ncbi:MAG: hypothetical protein ACTHJ4_04245, partial [Candidatus Nucleicultricaceae bacterium]
DARAYRNTIVPEARGMATQIVQKAEGYRQAVVAEAEGQSERFQSVLKQFQKAPDITRKRIYIDTMKSILKGTNKVLIDQKSQGIVPFLPMPELKAKPSVPEPVVESPASMSTENPSFSDMSRMMKKEVKP